MAGDDRRPLAEIRPVLFLAVVLLPRVGRSAGACSDGVVVAVVLAVAGERVVLDEVAAVEAGLDAVLPCRCGDSRVLAGASGSFVRDERGMRRCLRGNWGALVWARTRLSRGHDRGVRAAGAARRGAYDDRLRGGGSSRATRRGRGGGSAERSACSPTCRPGNTRVSALLFRSHGRPANGLLPLRRTPHRFCDGRGRAAARLCCVVREQYRRGVEIRGVPAVDAGARTRARGNPLRPSRLRDVRP